MTFYLKILNESRSRTCLKVDGASGGRHVFNWDPKLRAYVYHPKNQEEVDDLFRTTGRTTAYIFAPVSCGVDPAIPTPPTLSQAIEAFEDTVIVPLNDVLVEECLNRGIIVTGDDTDLIARRLAEAYDKGAASALNSLPAVAKKPRKAVADEKTAT
jgi:hypothetical protein